MTDSLIVPDWPLPPGVHAFVSTRHGGGSTGDYAGFNLATHVGDDPQAVAANRAAFKSAIEHRCGVTGLQLQWLNQVHGTAVHEAGAVVDDTPPQADALYSRAGGLVLNVLTADCLPVLFCAGDGSEIAVAHAGWRGLCNGILEATVSRFGCAPAGIRCWLGPAIGPCHYEVNDDVRQAFLMLTRTPHLPDTRAAFKPQPNGRFLADLYALARVRLRKAGITDISGEPQCTVCRHDEFYSYRHQAVTGRFATSIVRLPA